MGIWGRSNELKTIQSRYLTNLLNRDSWGHSGNLGIFFFLRLPILGLALRRARAGNICQAICDSAAGKR